MLKESFVHEDDATKRVCGYLRALTELEAELEKLPEDFSIQGIDGSVDLRSRSMYILVGTTGLSKTIHRNVLGVSLTIEFVPYPISNRTEELYRSVVKIGAHYVRSRLGARIYQANEYALLLMDNGVAIELEGFENYVRIPRMRLLLFAHTHPRAPASFSRRDIVSLAHMLSDGALASCVVGVNGVLCIYRVMLMDVRDYEDLIAESEELEDLDKLREFVSQSRSLRMLAL